MNSAQVILGGKARLFVAALGVFCVGLTGVSQAQTVPSNKTRLFLWGTQKAPIASPKPSTIADPSTYSATDSVRNPWLLEYRPTTPNGAAMIVIPGGGYDNLSPWGSEGTPAATTLSNNGITVFILRYRVKPYGYPHAMWDVQRAVRWVRANAASYNVDPNRIGVLGFSAGGHVASTAATHFDSGLLDSNATNGPHWYPGPKDSIDRVSSRPNFQGLIYPMTTMVQYVPGTSTAYAYKPGRDIYIGTSPSTTLVDYTSNEKQVTAQTPPAFLNWGTADNVVNTLNSTSYRDSLISKGVAVKTVVITGGTHDPNSTGRMDSLRVWMNLNGYTTALRAPTARLKAPTHAYRLDVAPDALGRTGSAARARRAAGSTLNVPITTKD
jgi:acetyl esterase/lipase